MIKDRRTTTTVGKGGGWKGRVVVGSEEWKMEDGSAFYNFIIS
jgi:hypothetical protein